MFCLVYSTRYKQGRGDFEFRSVLGPFDDKIAAAKYVTDRPHTFEVGTDLYELDSPNSDSVFRYRVVEMTKP